VRGVIVVWGVLGDPPVARVLEALAERGTDTVHLDDLALAAIRYDIRLGPQLDGWLQLDGRRIGVDDIGGIYLRPGARDGGGATTSATLLAVAESVTATVVNRPSAGRSNLSKPFQLSLIEATGLATPDTIVTSDATAAKAFLAHHQRIVYKSISGLRSIVNTVDAGEPERLDRVGHGPVQLQQWIDGLDVRVHVVGDHCFATSVTSAASDYRYASEDESSVKLAPFDLPKPLQAQLISLVYSMGLLVAGIDLRRTNHGHWVCFEVNPSPGFTYYEDHTGQPIAAAVAELLRRRRTS
jgi:glutathione synthase/RimK-type ligase-like ATP-grasp enzyme